MKLIPAHDPVAESLVKAIREGDVDTLSEMLKADPGLVSCRIHNVENDSQRSLLHVATDWPGNFPCVGETICVLAAAGADVNACFVGAHAETPLHWAASANDVAAIDALLDAGADLETGGSVIDGGTALSGAIGFWQWDAARRLVERGAKTRMGDEAALGLLDQLLARFENGDTEMPPAENINYSFWIACGGGQRETAEFLLQQGAALNWIPNWDNSTPLDAAKKSGNESLVGWLLELEAQPAKKA